MADDDPQSTMRRSCCDILGFGGRLPYIRAQIMARDAGKLGNGGSMMNRNTLPPKHSDVREAQRTSQLCRTGCGLDDFLNSHGSIVATNYNLPSSLFVVYRYSAIFMTGYG